MRTNRQTRRLRRALEHESVTSQAVARLQGQRIAQWAKEDRERIAAQVERIGSVRTLRRDEQAQAHQAASHSQIDAASAIYNEHTEIEESKRDYLIPRQSLTTRLYLRLFDPVMESEPRRWKQLDLTTKAKQAKEAKQLQRAHPANRAALAAKINAQPLALVEGTDDVVVWKSDRTLLSTSKVEQLSTVRVTRQSQNRRTFETETTDLPTWDENEPD